MQVVAIDFESFWSSDYSLTKLTPLQYVMDPRWETHSLSITYPDESSVTAIGETEVRRLVDNHDWSQCLVIGHNCSGFDAYVAAYRYGIQPRMWGCTLAMARPTFARTVGLSLKSLCKHFGIGVKDDTILQATKGRHLADFEPQEIAAMREYNKEDAVLCMRLFLKLMPFISLQEMWHIDCLIRMAVQPQFELHMGMLEAALDAEKVRQFAALAELAASLELENADEVRTVLASPTKFKELLESRGVDVPMKVSPTDADKMIPALAKTDQEFLALQEHEDPVVAQAALMRLDVKSTLTQTRIEAFQRMGQLTGGKLPIPLLYCGAITTGRDSGTEYNALNLPRIDRGKPKPSDALRNSIEAPEGFAIVVVDFSGIELRVNHYLWQVRRTMKVFNDNPAADLYTLNAQEQLGRLNISKQERQVEKAKQLGLGFGAGAFTFQRVARNMNVHLSETQAQDYVTLWRSSHPEIAGYDGGWQQCGRAIEAMHNGCQPHLLDPWGLVTVQPEGFLLPSGRMIRYPDLRLCEDGKWPDGRVKYTWFYGTGRHTRRLTGPKADENVVQALARDVMCDACFAIWQKTGHRPALRVYDELVYVVPDKEADKMFDTCIEFLCEPPQWWPELVLSAEGTVAYSYGDAK